MRAASRHGGREFDIAFPPPAGGVNLALPAHQVPLDQAANEWNMWLSPEGDYETRPGLVKVTASAFPGAVQGGFYSAALDEDIVAADGNLYSLDVATGIHTLIGALSGSRDRVSFVDFKGDCYLASGGAIQVYDGITLSNVTSSTAFAAPSDAWFLGAWDNMIWAGCAGSKVAYCGPRDSTDWGGSEESGGGVLYIQEGDGADISGLGVVGGVIVVFKGSKTKGPWSVTKITGSTSADLAASIVSNGVACIEGQTVVPLQNDLVFAGNGGVFTLGQLQDYVDPRAMPVSMRIKPAYESYTPYSAVYDAARGMLFLVTSLAVFVWHVGTQGWHQWKFAGGIVPTSVWRGENDAVYYGAVNGDVYKLTSSVFKDDGTAFVSSFRTSVQSGGSPMTEKLWKWLHVALNPLGAGTISVSWKKNYATRLVDSQSVVLDGSESVGWDGGFSFDVPGVGWDMDSFMTRRKRLSFRGRDIQIGFSSTAPFRFVGANVCGAFLGRTRDSWGGVE